MYFKVIFPEKYSVYFSVNDIYVTNTKYVDINIKLFRSIKERGSYDCTTNPNRHEF